MGKNLFKHLLVSISFIISSLVLAACGGDGMVTVQDAWARPGSVNDNGAIYFKIHNPGTLEDSLINASTNIAEDVELHMSKMDSAGVMTMEHQQEVPIPPGESISFEPGGLHVMIIGLQNELKPGDHFPLQLTFENAGDIEVDVEIREP
jgi:copper(I)-binding protein